MTRLLKSLQTQLGLVLAGYVTTYRVVSRKRARTKWTRHPYTLMALSHVGTKIRLVAVQSLAEWTLQFFS